MNLPPSLLQAIFYPQERNDTMYRSTNEPSYNPHPNHNHTEFNSDLNVHVTGGDSIERQLLVDAISSSLHKRGFEGAKAIGEHGWVTGNELAKPKSVFDAIQDLRPDLLKKDIAVTSTPLEQVLTPGYPMAATPVKFQATGNDGKTFTTESKSGREFLNEAEDLGIADKITVTGKNQPALMKAAGEILQQSPRTEVTIKVELEPWQLGGAYQRPYYAPRDLAVQAAMPAPETLKSY